MKMTPEAINDSIKGCIAKLPPVIEQDDPEGGVLRPWVRKLPLRCQGVILTSIRGCDGAQKEDDSKHLSRMIRRAVMNPADPRETDKRGGFFGFNPEALETSLRKFFHSLDQYPLHYVVHLMHASEVIGYLHPDRDFANFFYLVYRLFVSTLHLNPETEDEMISRLILDRIAAGTTERNF